MEDATTAATSSALGRQTSMPKRFCLTCFQPTTDGTRHTACQAERNREAEQQRGTRHERGYDYRWTTISTAVLKEHRDRYGDVCPGWQREAHPATDLTVDHVIPKSAGGGDDRANLQVLCRSCNSSKRNRK